MAIHPTAIISPQARIDPTVDIGPYVIIEDEVTVGPYCRIYPHVFINGYTTIGAHNEIHAGAIIGDLPQDLAFKDCRSYVRIGDHNVIREGVTIHRGTTPETATEIGNHCYLMAFSHVAHNCRLADHIKLANGALLAGHVHVGEGSFISGMGLVHQFVRIGRLCMIAGGTRVIQDIPPFMMAWRESEVVGINRVGLKRAGVPSGEIMTLRAAYRLLFRSGQPFRKAFERLQADAASDLVRELIAFLQAPSKRGISGPPKTGTFSEGEPDEKD
jgi:UDP-N-acetylglucosamine acyltransferase